MRMLRRLATLLAVLVPGLAAAASPRWPEAVAEALSPIAADVTGGILLDRALPISRIDRFDGSDAAPAATPAAWRQMYDEIRRAADSAIGPETLELRERARQLAATGVIPVAMLDFGYDRLRPGALEEGAIEIQGSRLHAVDGSALESRRVFAAAATKDYTHHGEGVSFVFGGEWYFGDSEVRSLSADFGDGRGWVSVRPGRPVAVRYSARGTKSVRLRALLSDGAVRTARFAFDVRRLFAPAPHETLSVTATVPYQGVFGTGEAYVYRSDANPVLTNPVIVVEGFDLDNTLNWDELYELLNQQNLLEDLRAEGFDAVVLNFTEATDPLQRNAFVVAELIRQVDAMIPAMTTNVVVGASMGGLCARYALTYLEQQAIDHRTRTFVSFDAPHRGANIPLGVQHWLEFFSGQSTDAAFLLGRLDTPAARQMLVYHHKEPQTGTGEPDSLRADWEADLAGIGSWPSAPRLTAIANGSGQSANQGFAAGAQLISYEYRSFLVDIDGDVFAVPDGTPSTLILDGLIDIILLPKETLQIVVQGTDPYDNAPGGKRDTMFQMDTTAAPYGDIVALQNDHCFVPTVSALDLNVADLFHDVSADPDPLAKTAFDVIHFPAVNEPHVEISPQAALWILDEVRTGVVDAPVVAAAAALPPLSLRPSAPNPFRAASEIRFRLGSAAPVTVDVLDVSGRLVRRLVDGRSLPAGEHSVRWERGRLAAGVYLYRVRAAGASRSAKAVLLR